MHFIFRGLARVDGFSDLRASSKDSVETVEILEELPSTEASLDISPSLRLAAPLSSVGSIPILSRAVISRTSLFPGNPPSFWKYSLFFPLPIILILFPE